MQGNVGSQAILEDYSLNDQWFMPSTIDTQEFETDDLAATSEGGGQQDYYSSFQVIKQKSTVYKTKGETKSFDKT